MPASGKGVGMEARWGKSLLLPRIKTETLEEQVWIAVLMLNVGTAKK